MSTMIERVARALCLDSRRKRNQFWEAAGKPNLKQPEDSAEDHSWHLFEHQARVAIEAMRVPTLEMAVAAELAEMNGEGVAGQFCAAIDAALKEVSE